MLASADVRDSYAVLLCHYLHRKLVNQHQQRAVDYLIEENRVFREQIGNRDSDLR
jgi:hypothetical protein